MTLRQIFLRQSDSGINFSFKSIFLCPSFVTWHEARGKNVWFSFIMWWKTVGYRIKGWHMLGRNTVHCFNAHAAPTDFWGTLITQKLQRLWLCWQRYACYPAKECWVPNAINTYKTPAALQLTINRKQEEVDLVTHEPLFQKGDRQYITPV